MGKPPPLPEGRQSAPRYRKAKAAMDAEHYDLGELMRLVSSSFNSPDGFMRPTTNDTNAVITATELIHDLLQLAIIIRFVGVHLEKPFVTKSDVTEAFSASRRRCAACFPDQGSL
jgi:hypothetical protein